MEALVTSKKDSVLEFFFIHPTRQVHLRELSRELKISLPWVRKLVIELSKEQFLTKRNERNLVLVQANRDLSLFRNLKRCFNLASLYKSGLVGYLNEAFGRPGAIILFGSYARGEDTEQSDIDIALLTSHKFKLDLLPYEKILHRNISVKEFHSRKIEKEFLTTLANGIVLSGYLEL